MAAIQLNYGDNPLTEVQAKGRFWQRLRSVLFLLPAWFAPHKNLRVFFQRLRGVKIGKNVEIGYLCFIDNVYPDLVTIEDNAVVTFGTILLAHDNSFHYTFGEPVHIGRTTIGKNAFIGMHAVILPEVTVGAYAIVGANSVVTKNVPPRTIVGGVPAHKIRHTRK